jgi:hypothetical protein
MSETLMIDPGSALAVEVSGRAARYRPASVTQWTALPTVQRGQLWLVELPATEPNLAPLEHQALTTANVVIYDRALTPTVARFLPLGGYAEPAPRNGGSDAFVLRATAGASFD